MSNSYKDKDNIYNVDSYTDKELFDLLDLNNPSDRELEAKILHMVWKYNNIGNESAYKLVKFFEDIYDHFFYYEEDQSHQEGLDNNLSTNNNPIDDTSKSSASSSSKGGSSGSASAVSQSENANSDNRVVNYSYNLDYSKDILNPLLKQTTKRIVSIDSQYREDKNAITTKYTFDLSVPLKDVVALRLYSIQIPYTWYTINANYGSNLIYLKGTSSGINDGYHDVSFNIPIGNYTANDLVTAVNTSIQQPKKTPSIQDMMFVFTNIMYGKKSSKATIFFDINNNYNENAYELFFPYRTSPKDNTTNNTKSIPGFLGFNNQSYTSYSFFSNKLPSLTDKSAIPPKGSDFVSAIYPLDASNNFFTVYQYLPYNNVPFYLSNSKYILSNNLVGYINDPSYNNIIQTFTITSSLPINNYYSRNAVLTDFQNQINNNPYLSNSGITRFQVTDPSNTDFGYSKYRFDIRLNRYTTQNILNSKLSVILPNELSNPKTIWLTSENSLFNFNKYQFELSNTISETPITQTNFIINSNTYIYLKCIQGYLGYDGSTNQTEPVTLNDYTYKIPNSTSLGYTFSNFLSEFNNAIKNENINSINTSNPNGVFNGVFNNTNDNNKALYTNGQLELTTDINKSFLQNEFYIDFTNTVIYDLCKTDAGFFNYTTVDLSNQYIFDLSFSYTGPLDYQNYKVYDDKPVLKIYPKTNTNNKFIPPISVKFISTLNPDSNGIYTYTNVNKLFIDLNNSINSYVDYNNETILSSSYLTSPLLINQSNEIIFYDFSLNVTINKQLSQHNYNLFFVDPEIFKPTVFNNYGNGFTKTNYITENICVSVGNDTSSNTISYTTQIGQPWKNVSESPFSVSANDIVFKNEANGTVFVAVGTGGNTIAHSFVGKSNWYGIDNSPLSSGNRIYYDASNTTWWALGVGNTTTMAYTTNPNAFDGWTAVDYPPFTDSANDIFWNMNGNVYIAVGSNNSIGTGNTMARSYDNDIWYNIDETPFSITGNSIFYDYTNNIWVAGGSGGNTIAYSSNITNWTSIQNTPFSNACNKIAFNGIMYVAVGTCDPSGGINPYIGNTIAYSYNIDNWVGVGSDIFTCVGTNIKWDGINWIATGKGSNSIAYSTDGIHWIGDGTFDNWNNIDNIWNNIFGISQYEYDMNLEDPTQTNNTYYSIIGNTFVGESMTINFTNNKVNFTPLSITDGGEGVYTPDGNNDIIITLPYDNYTLIQLINELNKQISTQTNYYGYTLASGSQFYLIHNNDNTYNIGLWFNINRNYNINDYRVVFYDPYSFVKCSSGFTNIRSVTWDSTLGWILGFRTYTEYILSQFLNSNGKTASITGDTTVSVSLYNYFLITLDDYNQSHLNDGLVTTTQKENDIPLPSYSTRATYRCDPVTGKLLVSNQNSNGQNNLTQNQIYAAQEILNLGKNNINTVTTSNNLSTSTLSQRYYSNGPFAKDVFAIVPLKVYGQQNNSIYVEFGGTLQNQERLYFGPVNIRKLTVTLLNDHGEVVDLNGANWSFSLLCEQLYQQSKT